MSPAEQADSLPSELQKNPVQLNMCQVRYIRDQYLSLFTPVVSRSHPRDPLNSLLFILEFLFSLVNKGCFPALPTLSRWSSVLLLLIFWL